MNISEQIVQEKILGLLDSQKLAVLSTQRDGHPYSSLMAFASTTDLHNIVVATSKSTRKHQNIIQESRVSLLIDNRSNNDNDVHAAIALTVLGKAQLVEEAEREMYLELYLSRHPYLEEFSASPSTAFFRIGVYQYFLVSQFQKVMQYTIQSEQQ